MKKLLFSLLAVGLVLTSCGGTSPTKFNNAIIGANTAISEVGNSYMNTLSVAVSTNSYESIAAATDSALVKIDAELDIIKALEVPKGGDAYKDAAVKAYESLRAVVESGKKFSTLTEESSVEDMNKISEEYEVKMQEYTDNFTNMTKAQAEYAAEAGYEIR
jgi:hypothetical protein